MAELNEAPKTGEPLAPGYFTPLLPIAGRPHMPGAFGDPALAPLHLVTAENGFSVRPIYRLRLVSLRMAGTIWLAIFAMALADGGSALAVVGEGSGSPQAFCKSAVVRDLARPPRTMPKVRSIPSNRTLPFGPSSLRLFEIGALSAPGLITGGGRFGYTLVNQGVSSRPRLDWRVKLSGAFLDLHGRVKRKIGNKVLRIGAVGGPVQPGISLRVPDVPGFYRFEISIEEAHGEQLGQFSQYMRVMKPKVSVKVGVSHAAFSVGERAIGRLENLGTTITQFGAPYSVEYFDGVNWVRVGPNRTVWPRYGAILYAGAAGGCMSFTVPFSAAPGQYRFLKQIESGVDSRALEKQHIYGKFTVMAGPRS